MFSSCRYLITSKGRSANESLFSTSFSSSNQPTIVDHQNCTTKFRSQWTESSTPAIHWSRSGREEVLRREQQSRYCINYECWHGRERALLQSSRKWATAPLRFSWSCQLLGTGVHGHANRVFGTRLLVACPSFEAQSGPTERESVPGGTLFFGTRNVQVHDTVLKRWWSTGGRSTNQTKRQRLFHFPNFPVQQFSHTQATSGFLTPGECFFSQRVGPATPTQRTNTFNPTRFSHLDSGLWTITWSTLTAKLNHLNCKS